jgi:hypothetical protein
LVSKPQPSKLLLPQVGAATKSSAEGAPGFVMTDLLSDTTHPTLPAKDVKRDFRESLGETYVRDL